MILKYFSDVNSMYEFFLLYLDGESRCRHLNITGKCFSDKDYAKKWYENIRNNITDEKAINVLNKLYNDMIK